MISEKWRGYSPPSLPCSAALALHYAVIAAKVEVIKYLVHTLNVPITVTAEVN